MLVSSALRRAALEILPAKDRRAEEYTYLVRAAADRTAPRDVRLGAIAALAKGSMTEADRAMLVAASNDAPALRRAAARLRGKLLR